MDNLLPESLFASAIIRTFSVLEHVVSEESFLLKLRITLTAQLVLSVHERIIHGVRKHSFHWQQPANRPVMWWDNAPHFRAIAMFPHHLHDYWSATEVVVESYNITLTDVLEYIRQPLNSVTES